MRLLNRTECPDGLLVKLIKRAAKAVGARYGNIDVIVGQNYNIVDSYGRARNAPFGRSRSITGRWHEVDGGEMEIHCAALLEEGKWKGRWSGVAPLEAAERFWFTLLHELAHIRDYQYEQDTGQDLEWSRKKGRRRPKHDKRPEEIRANSAIKQAQKEDDGGELLLEWAIWYEEACKKN